MFQLIWRLCTFQAKPEEVPYSISLLLGKIIVNLTVLVFIVTIATSSLIDALWRSASFVGLVAIYSLAILIYYGFPERFVQVLSGLFASMAMILVPLAIPYVIIMFFLADVSSNTIYFTGLTLSNGLLIIASLWVYVIFARIFKHALEVEINQGLVISFLLFLLCAILFWFV